VSGRSRINFLSDDVPFRIPDFSFSALVVHPGFPIPIS
jgi:hypothetical protein